MPVTASPFLSCAPVSVPVSVQSQPTDCTDIFVMAPSVSTDRGRPLLKRLRSVTLPAQSRRSIEWTLVDPGGRPVDISQCVCAEPSENCPKRLKFRLSEYISRDLRCPATENDISVVVVDGEKGLLRIDLERKHTSHPGVYFGEVLLYEKDAEEHDVIHLSNVFYVVIQSTSTVSGPPSIAEIRLLLRDSAPDENYLLDNLKFDDAEIAYAIALPIQQFNETPPLLSVRYTTESFPFRYHWLHGIVGHLFLMAGEKHRANRLQYNAGGIAVQDMDKEPNYEQVAQRHLALWDKFLRHQKIQMNLERCYGWVASPYSYLPYRRN